MVTRIIPATADAELARTVFSLLSQLPDTEPLNPVGHSTALLDLLASVAAESVADLPEVVLVHERIGPVPALELIREIGLRFPAVGTVLITTDASPAVYSAAMDSGARGVVGLPLAYEELAARTQSVAQWATGVRRHLGNGPDVLPATGGTVVAVSGAKGGVGTTLTAVQLALAAQAAGGNTALIDMDLQAGDVASFLDVQFRRSVADLAGIGDLSPRVLQDAVFAHPSGLALLLAPADGERSEEVTDAAARQIVTAMSTRYDTVVIDCGTQLNSANAAAVEMADTAVLVTTPDVVAVRGVKRMVKLWDRLQIRKAEETVTVVNRHTRGTEIQPPLIQQITGTLVARTTVPANFRELQGCLDSSRMHELDSRGAVRQALWALAGELGLTGQGTSPQPGKGLVRQGDRGALALRRRRGTAGER